MKNVIIIGLSALLLFSLSAALSLWLNAPPTNEKKKTEDENAKVLPKKEAETLPDERPTTRKDNVPSPIIPGIGSTPPSPEEAAQLLSKLRERAATLDRREQELKRREDQARVILEDLKGERAILDGLKKQIADELKAAGDRTAQLDKRATELDDEKARLNRVQTEVKKVQLEVEGTESKNLSKYSAVTDNMEPEKAAQMLKNLADNGKLDTAVKILAYMKPGRAAAVLGEMNDAMLSAQILDRMRGLRPPPTPSPTTGQ